MLKIFLGISVILLTCTAILFGFYLRRTNPNPFSVTSLGKTTYYNNAFGYRFLFDDQAKIIKEDRSSVLIQFSNPHSKRQVENFGVTKIKKCNDIIKFRNDFKFVAGQKALYTEFTNVDRGIIAHCLQVNGQPFYVHTEYDVDSKESRAISKDFFDQTVASFEILLPQKINTQVYFSKDLGIKFDYKTTTSTGDEIIVTKKDNKLYVHTRDEKDFGKMNFIEVVKVPEGTQLQYAIESFDSSTYSDSPCFQVFNVQQKYEEDKKWDVACTNKLVPFEFKSRSYFLKDLDVEDRFVFVYRLDSSGNVTASRVHAEDVFSGLRFVK